MMYRGDKFEYNKIQSAFTLKAGDFVEFFTYFNSFSIGKWKKYTNAGDIELNLVCKGKFKITMFGHYHDGAEILKEFYPSKEYDLKEKTEISLFVPRQIRATTVGFQIDVYDTEDENDEDFCFYSGYWSTIVDDSKINDVRISIVTVTFKKEDYITSNIKILERELFYTDEPAKDHIRVRIIDNDGGKVLDSESMISEYVHYSPNANVGGSGGYTRGMIESINDTEYNPTHVLLMDDDVIVLPESFIRTYSLLALVKKEYDERFVSGAMLFYERMDTQHEDVGYVHDDGSYGPNKHDMHLEQWDHVLENDEDFKYHKNSYAGWWYCCIPVKKMDKNKFSYSLLKLTDLFDKECFLILELLIFFTIVLEVLKEHDERVLVVCENVVDGLHLVRVGNEHLEDVERLVLDRTTLVAQQHHDLLQTWGRTDETGHHVKVGTVKKKLAEKLQTLTLCHKV